MKPFSAASIFLAFFLVTGPVATAQPGNSSSDAAPGHGVPFGDLQEQIDDLRHDMEALVDVINDLSHRVTSLENGGSGIAGVACPEGGSLTGYDDLGRQLCSNGYVLTADGPVALHCENLDPRPLGANFRDCDLSGMDFSGMRLESADFTGADLTGANFANANLRNSKFNDALVISTYFVDADLRATDWYDAVIDDTSFINADMNSVYMWGLRTLMTISNSNFLDITGPLYTSRETRWINTICPDGTNSDESTTPQSCVNQGPVYR